MAGSCRDNAGNQGSNAFGLSYDATAPTLSKVSVASGAAADVVRWSSTSAADTVVVRRVARGNKAQSTIFRGRAASFADKKVQKGLEYVYSVQAYDQADNASKPVSTVALPKVLTLRKTPTCHEPLRSPSFAGTRCAARATTTCSSSGARNGSSPRGPTAPELALPAAWRWAGHSYRLSPGRYRWYVWEGLGRRSFARYRSVGSASFIVPRR